MSRQSQSLYDRHITVFSPEGKLFQVEYAFRAMKACGTTGIALRGPTCACVAVQRRVPNGHIAQTDKMLDMTSVHSVWAITRRIGSAFVGRPGDPLSMVYKARDVASKFEYTHGYPIPTNELTLAVANQIQVYTQHAYMRLRACEGVFIGIDEETNKPTIFKVDPAGWFSGYHGCVIGSREQEGINALEKVVKTPEKLDSTEKVIEETVATLQSIVGTDFKPIDVEVAIVSLDNPEIKILDLQTIENYLNQIAERD